MAVSAVGVGFFRFRVWLAAVRVVAVGPRMSLYTEGGRRRIIPPLVLQGSSPPSSENNRPAAHLVGR